MYIFNRWVIFHCVYVPQLSYPFVCQWTSRLLPCPGYCKQCCDEHWGTCASFNSGFLSVYAQQWDCWVVWPPHVKSWLIGKDSDAGRDWGQEEKGTTEDEMVGWHHRLSGHGFEQTPGDGQGSLACCSSWGHKESDMTEWLNWTELRRYLWVL